jgi:hypothetical protein
VWRLGLVVACGWHGRYYHHACNPCTPPVLIVWTVRAARILLAAGCAWGCRPQSSICSFVCVCVCVCVVFHVLMLLAGATPMEGLCEGGWLVSIWQGQGRSHPLQLRWADARSAVVCAWGRQQQGAAGQQGRAAGGIGVAFIAAGGQQRQGAVLQAVKESAGIFDHTQCGQTCIPCNTHSQEELGAVRGCGGCCRRLVAAVAEGGFLLQPAVVMWQLLPAIAATTAVQGPGAVWTRRQCRARGKETAACKQTAGGLCVAMATAAVSPPV